MPKPAWRSSSWRINTEPPVEQHEAMASGKRIYLGNMPYTAQRRDVANLLKSEIFQVASIDISINRLTSRNPSYCFVDMFSSEDAERAMREVSGKFFLGRPLKVKPCVQKRPDGAKPHSRPLESTRWTKQQQYSAQTATSSQTLGLVLERRRLYLGGVPKPLNNQASDFEIRELFKGYNVDAVSKVKSLDKEFSQRNGYYAFVDLATPEEAESAIVQ